MKDEEETQAVAQQQNEGIKKEGPHVKIDLKGEEETQKTQAITRRVGQRGLVCKTQMMG